MSVELTHDLTTALATHFGFDTFRPGQREVIEHLLAGRSAAAVFPTGSGKSLCYQLPALLLPGVTVVVSPLIALMKDQIDALTARGIAARRIDSTLTGAELREVTSCLRRGRLRLLYVAPERFQNERFRELLRQTQVALFAVDEAHCISEWGHNFRPDYLKLVEFAQQCGAERILALTATAMPAVLDDICRALGISPECAVRTGFYRPNLRLLTTPVSADERMERLVQRLSERPPGATIVYVTLQRTAEEVAQRLVDAGFNSRAYHAGMENADREQVQNWFFSEATPIVVATIAFGMGIDKSDLRYVYHYNLSKSLENYAQEIGRAGRDGEESVCEMFACLDDRQVLENFAYGDTPSLAGIDGLLAEIFAQSGTIELNFHELAGKHDIRLLVVRTLLTYLELDGYLEGGTPFYSGYRFKALMPSARILSQFTGDRREFLERLFRLCRRAKLWMHIDAADAARQLHADRDRVIRALDYLAEQGWIELDAEGVRHRYQILRPPHDRNELARMLHGRTVERERREILRVRQIVELAEHDGCQVAALCRHFGEELPAPCGHCNWCLNGQQRLQLPPGRAPTIDVDLVERARALRRKYQSQLRDARSLARFLCGLNSPAFARARLPSQSLYGALETVPFPEVLRVCEECLARR